MAVSQIQEREDHKPPRSNGDLVRENYWLREVIETRLDGMDKALLLLQTRADKVPSDMDIALGRLKELLEEKFRSVATQFIQRDDARKSTQDAQSEAIKKSEAGFTKELDGLKSLIATTLKGTDDKIDTVKTLITAAADAGKTSIDDTKERLLRIETQKLAVRETATDARENWGTIFAAVGATAVVITIIFVIVDRIGPPPPVAPTVVERTVAPTNDGDITIPR